mmetsp:Transcript_9884/g.19603  ORF Transcript_9884/g.19603 Transcript_9884/m.19603 type:complete len:255 (-) Transcript_9884:1000-1764(-)
MSVGDLTNSLEKLRRGLRSIRFPIHLLDEEAVREGHAMQYMSILQYCLQSYSVDVTAYIADHKYDLSGPPDSAYLETVYRVLRELLDYRPILSLNQFLKQGYAERKILMSLDVLSLVVDLHESLVRTSLPVTRATTPQPSKPSAVLKRSPPRAKTPVKNTLEFCSPKDMFQKTMTSPNKSYFQHSPEKHARASLSDKKQSKSSTHTPQSLQIASTLSAILCRLDELDLRVSSWMTKTDERLEWLTASVVKLGLS